MIDHKQLFDAIVVGSGPAGATAATLLASRDRKVALVDAAKFPRSAECAGWLSAGVEPILKEMGVSLSGSKAKPFKEIAFYTADFEKSASPALDASPGHLIERVDFDAMLIKAAKKSGVALFDQHPVTEIKQNEESVTLGFEDHAPMSGRILVFAAGRGSPLLRSVLYAGGAYVEGGWTAHVHAEDKRLQKPTVWIVLGIDKFSGFAMVAALDGRISIGVQTMADRKDVIPSLVMVCRHLHEKQLVSQDFTRAAAAAIPVPSPTATALSMDTHVGKCSLVIGDAGGFVAAISGEGIYPAMWSAKIAVEVIDKALAATSPQDELMAFNAAWRTEMADYLRPPNTDIHYLLPLIFSNQPMADRMGAAFFSGENI